MKSDEQAEHRHDLELHLLSAMRHLLGQGVQLEVEDADPDDGRHDEDRHGDEQHVRLARRRQEHGEVLRREGMDAFDRRDRSSLSLRWAHGRGAGSG